MIDLCQDEASGSPACRQAVYHIFDANNLTEWILVIIQMAVNLPEIATMGLGYWLSQLFLLFIITIAPPLVPTTGKKS